MELQHDDYLGQLAFREGEYERLEQTFDLQVEQLAGFLGATVQKQLESQAHDDASTHWAATIRQLAEGLLDSAPGHDRHLSQAQASLRAELQAALAQGDWPTPAVLEQEARSCSREISQLVLARWFEVLHRGMVDQKSLALTPNLLPDGMTLHDTFAEIDLEARGIDEPTMNTTWRGYWEAQTHAFRQHGEPIELGTELFLVPERSETVNAYRLFPDLPSARLHAAAHHHAMQALHQGTTGRIAEIAARLAEKLRSTVTGLGIPASSKTARLAQQEGWDRALYVTEMHGAGQAKALAASKVHRKAAEIFRAQDDAPERRFATVVGQGLDAVFACSRSPDSVSTVELGRHMPQPPDELRRTLAVYADSRAMTVADAADLYAVSIAGTWACQVKSAFAPDPAPGVFDPSGVLGQPEEAWAAAPALSEAAQVEAAATAHFWSNRIVVGLEDGFVGLGDDGRTVAGVKTP